MRKEMLALRRRNEGGLWGCMVVAAAFFIQVVTFGTTQSIGVYNVELLRYFDAGAAAVSLVGSINFGIFLGAGPLASFLMSVWSHRQVALFGALVTNIGLICLPFSPNLEYMYIFYGVVTGLGSCLVYIPSHILCGLYYSKHRSLATGVATAGSGLGATVFPIILHNIIEEYGWRGSLFIVAGLNLQVFVCAALLRPVPKDLQIFLAQQEKELATLDTKQKCFPEKADTATVVWTVENTKTFVADKDNNQNTRNTGANPKETTTDLSNSETERQDAKNGQGKVSFKRKVVVHLRSVLKTDFIIYWLSNIFWNGGIAIVLLFLPEYAVILDMPKDQASLLITMLGAGSCVGCVLGGLLGNIKKFDRVITYTIGNLGLGVATILVVCKPFQVLGGLIALSIIIGLMFGIILGLLVVVTSDLLGTEALGDGFGYLMFANGVGVFGGPPLAGLLIDGFNNMDYAVYLSAALSVLGGIVMLFVPLRKWCRQKLQT